ncbi:TetR/AcrR family transcriptional regulator [Actinomadura sp. WMMB 499]|uniref:TetR/AcrR family transcriptional regulator n=1 Tax=Actinomadura sp. WMMB 499 TaxID=1219491 RepID=UPI0012457189|nr:TetR/AcrR family transcriptional regulator [Actinomadura sp. WMMB 499]QFG21001.1 TetR/AcrR family transcriptional regulator [Actinomadura sp. WMMB 499]
MGTTGGTAGGRSRRNGTGAGEPANVRLSRAALELFAQKGFHATGIREIGAHAGVSTSMLYHYLRSKDEVLTDLVLEGVDRHGQALESACAAVDRPEERLAALIGVQIIIPVKHPHMSRLLQQELHVSDWSATPAISGRLARTNLLWSEVLEDGRAEGVFTFESVSLTRIALMRSTTLVTQWYREEGALGPEEMAARFADLGLGTVRAARDGRPLRFGDLAAPSIPGLIEIVEASHRDVWW